MLLPFGEVSSEFLNWQWQTLLAVHLKSNSFGSGIGIAQHESLSEVSRSPVWGVGAKHRFTQELAHLIS